MDKKTEKTDFRGNGIDPERENAYQVVIYSGRLPFLIHNINYEELVNQQGRQKDILEHWHSEVELCYTFAGHAVHYIDGKVYTEAPGKLLITNSESLHKVISDINVPRDGRPAATVLIINYEFLRSVIPSFREKYFVTEAEENKKEIREIMTEFSRYGSHDLAAENLPYCQQLFLMGKLYELLFYLCRDELMDREEIFPVNNEKNIERLRGIMLYVNEHYREPIRQEAVAKKFYFSSAYFSRFFRKNTGMTFKEYLMRVRIRQAREEILQTDHSILEVAMNTGFTDARALIHGFREIYDITPYQFRKKMRQEKENT